MKREPGAALAAALRWRWLLALQVAVALAVGAVLYAESMPLRYQATAVVSFTPEQDVGADLLRVVLPRYPVLLSSGASVDQVARANFLPADELRSGLRITTPADTANLQISVTLSEPRAAAVAANALAALAEQASRDDALLRADVVAPAEPDASASTRSRRLVELAGLAVGVLVGVLAAVLAEQSRPRLWSVQDLRALSAVPVAGRLRSELGVRLLPEEALRIGVAGRRIRGLRAALAGVDGPEGGPRVVLVTGATRGQGATTVATLLAASTSAARGRTLLLDADLEQPAVAERTGVERGGDLVRALRGERPVTRLARPVTSTLHVLSTDRDEDAADLLERCGEDLVTSARSSYGDVVIDAPPVLDGDLGPTLCRTADAVVLVVRHGTAAAEAREAVEVLEGRGARVALVANEFPEPGVVPGPAQGRTAPLLGRLRGWRARSAA